jgi:predicted DNA-binding transcriptional regulator YafY
MNDDSGRSSSIDRHLRLAADLFRGQTHDRHSLAERLGIRPAQADRLINAAVRHLPGIVEEREGKVRRIRIDRSTVTPAPSYPTAVAACFGSSLWPLFEGTAYQGGIRNALSDILGRTRRRAVFRDIDRKFWFHRRGGEVALLGHAALLDDIIEAVLHHRSITLEYEHFNGRVLHVRIDPLSIVVHDHQIYVVGRREDALHPYRFARIRAVDVLDEGFEYPSRTAYDPQQVFRDSFGVFLDFPVQDVEVKLHAQWAPYALTHRWHDSQVVDVAEDHVRVRLRVRVCPELEAWILGFGDQAEVVAPAKLRERVASRAAAMARTYDATKHAARPALRKTQARDASDARRISRKVER